MDEKERILDRISQSSNGIPPSARSSSAHRSRTGRYGASCTGCRKRKQRCDAQQPTCGRCQRLKEPCIYESSIRNNHLSTQIIPVLRETLQFLRSLAAIDPATSVEVPSRVREFLEATELPRLVEENSRDVAGQESSPQSGGDHDARSLSGPSRHTYKTEVDTEDEGEGQSEVDELLMHMSLAEDGQNEHFGVTSFVWQTPSPSVVERLQRRASQSQTTAGRRPVSKSRDRLAGGVHNPELLERYSGKEKEKEKEREEIWVSEDVRIGADEEEGILKANSAMLSGWESLAFHKLQFEQGPEQAKMTIHLLKTYFCWQYGDHCFVYPPVFLRDMALGGPYFNQFLLNVICANATTYSDCHMQTGLFGSSGGTDGTKTPAASDATDWLARAKMLLAVEMDRPSSIPTIQGLLIFGLRECSMGNYTQGWQYTGMAFRAMRDLGIHLDCSRLPIFGFGTLSAEDREIRRRLFWSAYTWDKIISLALGRTPTFNAWQNVSPGMIVDDTEDDQDWAPHFWEGQIPVEMQNYPVQRSYLTTNYRHFIKLTEVITKIIMRLYNGRPQRLQNIPFVVEMRRKLDVWFKQLPTPVRMDVNNLPEDCPPPHIFSTNALYRATIILLYRMFLPNVIPVRINTPAEIIAEASQTCTQMAEELHQLFLLYHKSFHLRNMTYTISWSMYSAAMINAIDFKSADPILASAASARLVFSLHVLERGSVQTPGTRRSVDVIKQRLRAPSARPIKRSREENDESEKRLVTGKTEHLKPTITEEGDPVNSDQEVSGQVLPTWLSNPGCVWGLGEGQTNPFITTPDTDIFGEINWNQSSYEQQSDQTGNDNALPNFYSNMVGEPSVANGMDLLQGMMAMPSSGVQTTYPENWHDWTV